MRSGGILIHITININSYALRALEGVFFIALVEATDQFNPSCAVSDSTLGLCDLGVTHISYLMGPVHFRPSTTSNSQVVLMMSV